MDLLIKFINYCGTVKVFYASAVSILNDFSIPLNFLCYAVSHNILKSPVLAFLHVLVMKIWCYHNVWCALKATCLIVYSLCKNIAMEYSLIQKRRYGLKRERRKETNEHISLNTCCSRK